MDDLLQEQTDLSRLDPQKLKFLQDFTKVKKPKSAKEAMTFLSAVSAEARSKNIHFEKEEIALLIEVLSHDLTDREKTAIQRLLTLLRR